MEHQTKEYSNIITPPDFPTDPFYTVLLIDPAWDELDVVTLFLKTAPISFNVYVYQSGMKDQKWFDSAVSKADAIVVNTVANEDSPVKDKLVIDSLTLYYGPKSFLGNENQISKPIDYFVGHLTKQEKYKVNELLSPQYPK